MTSNAEEESQEGRPGIHDSDSSWPEAYDSDSSWRETDAKSYWCEEKY